MLAPSGDQFEIVGGGYRAVVTESGGALRHLSFGGRDLIDGFAEDQMASGGRGQLLMPWPNRIRDGRYSFGGSQQQLALTEPKRQNASHGLVRWVAWSVEEHSEHSVSLAYRVMAQTGYPWTLDVHVVYDLSADGLTVTQGATNLSDSPAPYAHGAHPYLTVGVDPVDSCELTIPATVRSLVDDERLLPTGREDVEGTAYDFRAARPIGTTTFNTSFTDLRRDPSGVATTVLRDPETNAGVALWVDEQHRWLLVYTGDDTPTPRRSVAVEPMTAQADAFNSGEDLITLEPHGAPGDTFSATWGIRALD